jgi:DNA-directed RNA polymerase specialized sigma24 family protein
MVPGSTTPAAPPPRPQTLGDLVCAEPPPPDIHETAWRTLVERVAEGDTEALLEIYDRSHGAVFTLLVRMTFSAEIAEALTAEVYRALYRTAPRWRRVDTLVVAWLLRRARSLALGRMRRDRRMHRARHHGNPGPFTFDMPDYASILRFRALERDMAAALPLLTPDDRRVLEAMVLDGHTLEGAAAALGLAPSTASEALQRAIRHLAGHLGRAEVEVLEDLTDALVAWPTDLLRARKAVRSTLLDSLDGAPAASLPECRSASHPRWSNATPQIAYSLLAADLGADRVAMFVRLAPGGLYPPHQHAAEEELYLLSGELWIDAVCVHPGEYARASAGTRDRRVWSGTGCTCVLITSTRDVLEAP